MVPVGEDSGCTAAGGGAHGTWLDSECVLEVGLTVLFERLAVGERHGCHYSLRKAIVPRVE